MSTQESGVPLVEALANDVIELIRPSDVQSNRQDIRQRFDVQEAEQEYRKEGHSLHNSQLPNLVVAHERPEHRIMLLCKLKGMTNKEIAEASGYTESWISQITRQPWFKQRLTEMLDAASEDVFEDLIRVEGKNSFMTQVYLRDNAKSEQVRLSAANEIVNRLMGKPVQPTENTTKVFHVTTKLEDLDAKLRQIEEEEKRLLGLGNELGTSPPAVEDRFKP